MFVRAGATEMGIIKSWEGHAKASMLTTDMKEMSVLYKNTQM